MKISFLIGIVYVSVSIFAKNTSAKLIVIEDSYQLQSANFSYPHNEETLDVIWLFDHSIRLQINEFHLNGHLGDFLLLSEYPLRNAEYFKSLNGTEGEDYVDYLSESILTEQGLLLSWMVDSEIVEVVNQKGTFVFFHSEKKDPSGTASFDGFDIDVIDYDELMTTTTSTTPDPVISPRPGQKIYISKFLDCMPPLEFFDKTSEFKREIADMATEFCYESGITLEKGPIMPEEVNIPGPEAGPDAGLHYCDTTWSNYLTCVEVTFAIVRVDSDGNYVLPAEKMEKMWSEKASGLQQHGFCPYNPPKETLDLNTLVFIAFFCGIIISLSCLLAIAWIKNTLPRIQPGPAYAPDHDMDDRPNFKHFNKDNPLHRFFPSSMKPNQYVTKEELYPSHDYLDRDPSDVEQETTRVFKNRSIPGNSSSFESVTAEVHAYDNSGFERDQNEGSELSSNPLLLRTDMVGLDISQGSGGRGSASEI